MTDAKPMDPVLVDYLREHCYQQLVKAGTPELRRHWWERLKFYVNQRTPEQIEKIESERGLR